jgi:hypothetical protein
MIGGFNHNFIYQGELYHVQTEDSGAKVARIVTLLFREGTILASERHSYSDLIGREDLPRLVEERMKSQHKMMMHRLKDGEYDDVIGRLFPSSGVQKEALRPAAGTGAETADALGTDEPKPSDEELEATIFAYLTVSDVRYRQQ